MQVGVRVGGVVVFVILISFMHFVSSPCIGIDSLSDCNGEEQGRGIEGSG